MKIHKRKNCLHGAPGFIFLMMLIFFPAVVFPRSTAEAENYRYRSVLANPVVSRSYLFLSVNNAQTFGGSIGRSFTLYSRKTSGGCFNLLLNASARSLTHRSKMIFYLKDVDYLLGARLAYYLRQPDVGLQLSLEHVSSHLGDSYFLDSVPATEKRKPVTFSLEFIQLSALKTWDGFKLEGGVAHVYHTTQKIPRNNGFVGMEKDLFTISPSITSFVSTGLSYSLAEASLLQQVYQVGVKLDFPAALPLAIALEVQKGRFFWGQFYGEKQTDYQLKVYLNF